MADEDFFAGRPAFSPAERPPAKTARCADIRAMADFTAPEYRIDLALVGALTSVRSDGALWYLTMCNLPDLRVMCVTYQSNDMKTGDVVVMKGGYRRIDANHALLDPCLANRPDDETPGGDTGTRQ